MTVSEMKNKELSSSTPFQSLFQILGKFTSMSQLYDKICFAGILQRSWGTL